MPPWHRQHPLASHKREQRRHHFWVKLEQFGESQTLLARRLSKTGLADAEKF
jgi:hypothetical protein